MLIKIKKISLKHVKIIISNLTFVNEVYEFFNNKYFSFINRVFTYNDNNIFTKVFNS